MKKLRKNIKKKKRLNNAFKWKFSINKPKLKITIINIIKSFDKKDLLILVLKENLLIYEKKKVDIIIIDIDNYYATRKLKRAQVFILLIKNLK